MVHFTSLLAAARVAAGPGARPPVHRPIPAGLIQTLCLCLFSALIAPLSPPTGAAPALAARVAARRAFFALHFHLITALLSFSGHAPGTDAPSDSLVCLPPLHASTRCHHRSTYMRAPCRPAPFTSSLSHRTASSRILSPHPPAVSVPTTNASSSLESNPVGLHLSHSLASTAAVQAAHPSICV